MLIFVNHDDMRSLELMEEMIRRGYYVSDQFKDMKYADVLYLGLKGPDRKNRLLTHQETIMIDQKMLESLKDNCLILTLVHNAYLNELSKQYHFRYIALLDDENFVTKNSILTAEGLIAYLIAHRRMPIYHSHIDILGFGHCAKPIIEYLVAMQAKVRVAVRKGIYQKDIEEMGAEYIRLDDLSLSQSDILINTIPYVVVKEDKLDRVNHHIMIIDIASYPYGIDHHYALSKGLNCQILSSIPCKYAYGYAGKMVADEIERELENA
ncbi:NAD(P)-dependent oxidoreductase [Candidatus Stoquefichus sp. SB1]|uniref:NAD(P)-dependent oxidoreductase n=1 Tax=Candidatus Stoquefichus sp. SB1 TaxID=1658109 RepID=UPI00067EC296|nr:NAD(P)-dependent oxidoreductase [Candidatus Stoquefichus sp. SB1]